MSLVGPLDVELFCGFPYCIILVNTTLSSKTVKGLCHSEVFLTPNNTKTSCLRLFDPPPPHKKRTEKSGVIVHLFFADFRTTWGGGGIRISDKKMYIYTFVAKEALFRVKKNTECLSLSYLVIYTPCYTLNNHY